MSMRNCFSREAISPAVLEEVGAIPNRTLVLTYKTYYTVTAKPFLGIKFDYSFLMAFDHSLNDVQEKS